MQLINQAERIDDSFNLHDKVEMGCHLMGIGSLDKSAAFFRAALRDDPNNAAALSSLGGVLAKNKDYETAGKMLKKAISIKYDVPGAWFNLGVLMQNMEDYQEAERCFNIAMSQNVEGWLDAILCAKGTLEQFLSQDWYKQLNYYQQAVLLNPANRAARLNLGLTQMLLEIWEPGLKNYEARLDVSGFKWALDTKQAKPVDPRFPAFEPRKRVLVVAEQGAGDTIQFARYGRKLREMFKGTEFWLFCPNDLAELMRLYGNCWDGICSPKDKQCEDFDFQIPLMSVPLVLHTIFGEFVYPDHIRISPPRGKSLLPLRVGVCWAGNPAHTNDRFRSIDPFEIFRRYEPRMVSLQQGPVSINSPAFISVDTSSWISTATAMANLGTVVSVDTSVAHLAAAMGKPTWVLVPANNDWRWGAVGPGCRLESRGRDIERSIATSRWYENVRICRQEKLGDWGPTLDMLFPGSIGP